MAEITLEARIDSLSKVLAFLDEQLEMMDCTPKTQIQIDVAVEEMYVNVASYAYGDGVGPVTVRVEESAPRTVSITLIDEGVPYNPLAKPDPDVTLSAEEREIGGLGIFLVKKNMDKMEYHRDGEYNVLTISKKI